MKDIMPEWLVYEGEDTAEELTRCDERFKRSVAAAAAAAFVIAAVSMASGFFSPGIDELLSRGDYGEGSREIVLDLGMDIGGRRYHEDADILIREKELSEADAYHLFDRCAESLPAELAQRFGDGHAVSSDMDLPSEWNHVAISWRSEDPEIVTDDGQLLLPLPAEAVSVRFSVFMHAGGRIEEGQIEVPLDPFAADPDLVAERVAAGLSEDLSADSRGNVLELPADYRGVALEWKTPGVRFPTVVIPLLLLAVLALYFSKYDALKRECAKRRSAFEASVDPTSGGRLWVDTPCPGDIVCPLGMHGQSKKLADLLNEAHLPTAERERTPIVRADVRGPVVWVAGIRVDERAKCTTHTKYLLELSLSSAE